MLHLNSPGRFEGDRLVTAEADAEGRLTIPTCGSDAVLVIAAEGGLRTLQSGALRQLKEVRLEPYGAVRGRIIEAGAAKAGVPVSLSELVWQPAGPFHLRYSTNTGPDGSFAFTQVPAGEYKLARWRMPTRFGGARAITETRQWPVTVRPGRTNEVAYAFSGREVSGLVQTDPAGIAVDWQNDDQILALLPKDQLAPRAPNREDYATFASFRQAYAQSFASVAKLQLARQERSFPLEFASDGSFRIMDVPPGTYELRLRVTDPTRPATSLPFSARADELGSLTRKINVTPGTSPLDLGTFLLPFKDTPATRRPAPVELALRDLDGQPMPWAGIGGTTRLMVFWTTWSDRSREALADIRRLQAELGDAPGLRIVGVNLDDNAAEARQALKDTPYRWLQARIDEKERARVIETLELKRLPTVLLLDARGFILQRDLQGERLRTAVLKSLKS